MSPMRKDELRTRIRQTLRQFTRQALDELSLPIIARVKARLADARVVVAFHSLPDEVNTRQLLDELVGEGKTVLLPKVLDAERMELRRYTGVHDLSEGAFHIMEPVGTPFTDDARIDVILVPGVAFDATGHRLGRGRGYYDRYLFSKGSARTIGVCFDFQKFPEVPVDPWDVVVDEVI